MPELHLIEDEAVRYVLGELTAAERREFEARLAISAELRALVRELEQGTVALSMASPQRRPPQEVWTQIEKVVARDARRKVVIPAFGTGWWRSGWAAAAACLAGWLLYVVWANRSGPSHAAPESVAPGVTSHPAATVPDSDRGETENAPRQAPPADNEALREALELLQARAQEIGGLHWQIAELTNQMSRLSQAVAEQQSLLSEASRFKVFRLAPASADSAGATVAPVSTNLQRALFLAMARELGWAQSGSLTPGAKTESTPERQVNQVNFPNSAPTNQTGVDFIDLRTASNGVANPTGQSPIEPEPANTSEPSSPAPASTNAIPGFINGTNAFLAFDGSVVPTGGSLTFLTATASGQYEYLGAAVRGNNPLVVTVPFTTRAWLGGNITVVAGTAAGSSNVFHFSTPGVSPP